ncbi:NAD-dependent epimerase/dehydratase family protein [Puniceicoccus vermicola]|uniref:NAD-dependent epimerase/dehydratase family protein n=1 Tax=Puniceicoccus vermicola TaxID=388746 RepID=A0A7X1AUR2_9BACT|nr:NAD-dependent epimerase/dehydratase family protein [Puniceicoccus vermicola]MBC2600383.1 NAD-dependent epimerase/dehydratase family protein [Puniceicoccus vermicola]
MEGRILVTGASGFVGGAVCRALREKGFSVRGTGRRSRPSDLPAEVEYVAADLNDAAVVAELCAGVVAVVHMAAKAGVWGPREAYYQANVAATECLLESARGAGVQAFVFTSTPSVVFNGEAIQGGDESMPYGTEFPCFYPETKAEAERRVLAADGAGLRTLALRPHLIWGPGDPHLFPRVFERVDAGKLKIVGDGRNRVDLTYIDNVAAGHVAAVESLLAGRGGGRAYFLTQDEPVALWPFVNRVLEATGRAPVRKKISLKLALLAGTVCEGIWKIGRLGGEPPMTRFVAKELATDHWFSSAGAREVLGYEPVVSMEEGVERYLEALRNEN